MESWPLWNICVTNDHGCVPLVINTSRYFPLAWLITGFVTRLTLRVPLVEQELLTLPEHLNSPPVFSGVRVTRSLVLCVCFVDRCLSFSLWPLCRLVCSSSIYGFWLPFGIFKVYFLTISIMDSISCKNNGKDKGFEYNFLNIYPYYNFVIKIRRII